MLSPFWRRVLAGGLQFPTDGDLTALTHELDAMLGSVDPRAREGLALPALQEWIAAGVYDGHPDVLADLAVAGLGVGLGDHCSDSVLHRTASAAVLTALVQRDSGRRIVEYDELLSWADALTEWFLAERDLRGFVPGHGWAHAVGRGADAVAALGRSVRMGHAELLALLDVVVDRLVEPTEQVLVAGEEDHLADACLDIWRRNLLDVDALEPWTRRLSEVLRDHRPVPVPGAFHRGAPDPVALNLQAFLRALHLQLQLTDDRPYVRSDLLLPVMQALRSSNRSLAAAG